MFTEFLIAEGIEFNEELSVPFVPTDEVVVETMLDLARVGRNDLLYDLGSGDGRIVVAAAMGREARAIGIDMDPPRLEEAREFAASVGVEDRVEFLEEDFLTADFSRASVITMYLLPSINLLLRPRLLNELRPGTRIISHSFDMGDWKPDEKLHAGGVYIYKWTIPAPLAGAWQWQAANGKQYYLELSQQYQQLEGELWINGAPAELVTSNLLGNRLRISVQETDAPAVDTFVFRYRDGKLHPLASGQPASIATRPKTERV